MKKWEEPELKVLGVENTRTASLYGTQAGTGKKWVCSACNRDGRGDVNEIGAYDQGDVYHTPNHECYFCKNTSWIRVDENFVEPSGPSSAPGVGLS